MKKSYSLLLLSLLGFSGIISAQVAQPCGSDEMYKKYKAENPQIAVYEKIEEDYIKDYIRSHPNGGKAARTTTVAATSDTGYYEIPVVVHVVHNNGQELLSDNSVYALIAEMNNFYSLKNDTSNIVKEFKKYVGKAYMRFHLASTDPNGNPTNGITHHRTYLTYGYDDQAKQDQWPQSSYYNIWFENVIGEAVTGGVVLAYATFPASSAGNPLYDGVIAGYLYINDGTATQGSTIDHETGHIFNLLHTWNSSGQGCGVACGDDEVDDTPPTKGHFSTCNLTDTACAANYYKIYPDIYGNDSLVNYPDTTNTQNIMDYSDCTNMFSKGQVVRMHATLNSTVAFRSNLWDSSNLVATGVGTYSDSTGVFIPFAKKDLKPYPDFCILPAGVSGSITKANYMDRNTYFTFPGSNEKFVNQSWNDTITSLTWNFSNGAGTASVTQTNPVLNSSSVTNNFTTPGWVTMSMTATGNGSGDTTATWNRALFVADDAATPGIGYYQEFSGSDTAKWPMFNYYNNNLKWQSANVGYWDNHSVEYAGFDNTNEFGFSFTGDPLGDYDDLFSIPIDFSGYGTGPCSMSFYYSGASRTSNSLDVNDKLYIQYSVNKSNTWVTMDSLAKSALCNKGAVYTPYTPTSANDWVMYSKNLPSAARTPYTVFRFRYLPGTALAFDGTTYSPGTQSSGNNFYMDRVNFSIWPAGVGDPKLGNIDVAVVPNPTNGNAYVIIKDDYNTAVSVSVCDITGKTLYTTSQQLAGNQASIEIPKSVISVSGMYLVHIVTGNQVRTEKLVVE